MRWRNRVDDSITLESGLESLNLDSKLWVDSLRELVNLVNECDQFLLKRLGFLVDVVGWFVAILEITRINDEFISHTK